MPADVRKKLGIGPGSILEWVEEGDKIIVRRKGTYTSEDIRKVLFPDGPPKRASLKEMKEGIARGVSERYARSRH